MDGVDIDWTLDLEEAGKSNNQSNFNDGGGGFGGDDMNFSGELNNNHVNFSGELNSNNMNAADMMDIAVVPQKLMRQKRKITLIDETV